MIVLFKRLLIIALSTIGTFASAQTKVETFCNPLNLNYQFQPDTLSRREAADPVILLFKNKYYLFASKSRGYWSSDDLLSWKYISSSKLPVWDYAPTVEIFNDTVYFIASAGNCNIYKNANPETDNWKVVNDNFALKVTDPCLFRDDDGKVYLYYGCSNETPIMAVQLDANNKFNPIGESVVCINHNKKEHGWEESGETNNSGNEGWNEGAWMNKYNGKYYLQFASPGTEVKVYADGVYVSDNPLGPFQYMANSPFSYKPKGFVTGPGHGCTFKDRYGNYWHVATLTISIRHMFERRLGLFPAAFDADGFLHTYTAFGDYPQFIPNRKINFEKESSFSGWMLLSYNKPSLASSSILKYEVAKAFDEDIRTWWSAQTCNKGEWLSVDLLQPSIINAIQVNFADNDARLSSNEKANYQYRILASDNQTDWKVIIDKSTNITDAPHDYIVLEKPINARYIKLENISVPDGKFSVSDFRIFGKGNGSIPSKLNSFTVNREINDSRKAYLSWPKAPNANGYVVNYGIAKDKLYTSVMVYSNTTLELTGLNINTPYFFSIDVFNENGISKGTDIMTIK